MANRKRDVKVELLPVSGIHVWADTSDAIINGIKGIEGVVYVEVHSVLPMFVSTDPRYSTTEIAEEIKQLLSSEVPKAFLE